MGDAHGREEEATEEHRPFVSPESECADVDSAGPREPEYLSPRALRVACERGGLTTWVDRQGDYWFAYQALPVGFFPMRDPHRIHLMAFLGACMSTQEAADLCRRLDRRLSMGAASVAGNRSPELVIVSFEHDHPLPEREQVADEAFPALVKAFVEAIYETWEEEEQVFIFPSMPLRRAMAIEAEPQRDERVYRCRNERSG